MCFTSSLDAKQFLNENTASGAIALVLCSMMMPGLSGMQVGVGSSCGAWKRKVSF